MTSCSGRKLQLHHGYSIFDHVNSKFGLHFDLVQINRGQVRNRLQEQEVFKINISVAGVFKHSIELLRPRFPLKHFKGIILFFPTSVFLTSFSLWWWFWCSRRWRRCPFHYVSLVKLTFMYVLLLWFMLKGSSCPFFCHREFISSFFRSTLLSEYWDIEKRE